MYHACTHMYIYTYIYACTRMMHVYTIYKDEQSCFFEQTIFVLNTKIMVII